jgi:hypothetical protein
VLHCWNIVPFLIQNDFLLSNYVTVFIQMHISFSFIDGIHPFIDTLPNHLFLDKINKNYDAFSNYGIL